MPKRAENLRTLPLQDLLDRGGFLPRHIGPDEADLARMLDVIGVDSVEQLLEHTIPESIREPEPLALPPPVPEAEVIALLRALADRNEVVTSLIGAGWYDTHTPAVIVRNVLEDPGWYTAYTPY